MVAGELVIRKVPFVLISRQLIEIYEKYDGGEADEASGNYWIRLNPNARNKCSMMENVGCMIHA